MVRRLLRPAVLVAVIAVGLVAPPAPASAQVATVTTETELRTALASMSATPGSHLIRVAADIRLSRELVYSGTGALTIRPLSGGRQVIDANARGRVLRVTTSAPLHLVRLDLVGGVVKTTSAQGSVGGAIHSHGPVTGSLLDVRDNRADQAAAIRADHVDLSDSTLTGNDTWSATTGLASVVLAANGTNLTRTHVVDNPAAGNYYASAAVTGGSPSVVVDSVIARNGAGGVIVGDATITRTTVAGNDGLGLSVDGASTVTSSTVSGNTGVGLQNPSGPTTIVNTTVHANGATGLFLGWMTEVHVVHSTITDNAGAELQMVTSAELTLRANAIGGSSPACVDFDDPSTVVTSLGRNVVRDGTCALANPSDEQSVGNLRLASLADNGGPTLTRHPHRDSIVVDLIPGAGCNLATDQRGAARPWNDRCDSGAVEAVSPPPGGGGGGT